MLHHRGIGKWLEEREEGLSPLAARSRLSKGRARPEPPCPMRTLFQQDRDRIIHCKAFRRLKHKTQVFIAPQGDHYITRLTHTLQVSQIARDIARALRLNEDLTEAIALGHDLGHTPFGHVGEEVLDGLASRGFHHSRQSLRVVDVLENEGRGLNLTAEVREGILLHSKPRERPLFPIPGLSPEAQVVRFADAIAYINHDIADAIRAGLLAEEDLPRSAVKVLGASPSERINTMVCDLVENSWGVAEGKEPAIAMSPPVLKAAEELRDFLFEKVYAVVSGTPIARRSREVVRALYGYFIEHPERLPEEFQRLGGPDEQKVVDYIAGMTDRFAFQMAEELAGSGCR